MLQIHIPPLLRRHHRQHYPVATATRIAAIATTVMNTPLLLFYIEILEAYKNEEIANEESQRKANNNLENLKQMLERNPKLLSRKIHCFDEIFDAAQDYYYRGERDDDSSRVLEIMDHHEELFGEGMEGSIGVAGVFHWITCLGEYHYDEMWNLFLSYYNADNHHQSALSETTSYGMTPLHIAATSSNCSVKTMKLLIELYPKAAQVQDKSKRLPIHLVESAEKTCLLCDVFPEGVKCKDNSKHTPLFATLCSKCRESNEIVKLLLELYPEAARIPSKMERFPIDMAVVNVSKKTSLLLKVFLEGTKHKCNCVLTHL